MNIKYDKPADSTYIRLNSGKVKKTIKLKDRLIVDVDKNDNILGIEILDFSSQIPKKEFASVVREKVSVL